MPTSRIPRSLACKLRASRHRARSTTSLFVSTAVLLCASCGSLFAAPRAERALRAPQCAARAPAPRARARHARLSLPGGSGRRSRAGVASWYVVFSSRFRRRFLVCGSAGRENTAPPCADGLPRRGRRATRVRRAEYLWRWLSRPSSRLVASLWCRCRVFFVA